MSVDFTPNENLRYDGFSGITNYPVSVSFLFNPRSMPDTRTMFSILNPANDTQSIFMFTQPDGGANDKQVSIGVLNGASSILNSTNIYTLSQTNHVGLVWGAANSRSLYLNGVFEGTDTVSIAYPSSMTRVSVGGLDRLNPILFYDGSMGELAIYNTILTADDFYTLSLGVSPELVRPESLVFYDDLIRDPYNDRIGGLQAVEIGSPVVAEHPRVLYPSSPQSIYSIPPIPPSAIQSELRKFQVDNEVRQFVVDNEVRKFQIDNEVRSFDVN